MEKNSEKIKDLSYKVDIIRLSVLKLANLSNSTEYTLKYLMLGHKEELNELAAKLGTKKQEEAAA